jgi:hypothetical protein
VNYATEAVAKGIPAETTGQRLAEAFNKWRAAVVKLAELEVEVMKMREIVDLNREQWDIATKQAHQEVNKIMGDSPVSVPRDEVKQNGGYSRG